MNKLDLFFAKIPISEITIRASINSLAVIKRLEYSFKPTIMLMKNEEQYEIYGSYWGNYFKIRGHILNSDGTNVFPQGLVVGFAFLRFTIKVDTSPMFYGRVFDDKDGSTIRGHFGLPFIIFSLMCVLLILIICWFFPKLADFLGFFAIAFLFWTSYASIEFIAERKAIIDFLKGLYFDVIR